MNIAYSQTWTLTAMYVIQALNVYLVNIDVCEGLDHCSAGSWSYNIVRIVGASFNFGISFSFSPRVHRLRMRHMRQQIHTRRPCRAAQKISYVILEPSGWAKIA